MRCIALMLVLTACENPFACKEDTQVIEAEYGSPYYEVQLDLVAQLEKSGFDCESESIRAGNGNRIGDKYTCTKCD
jgi:hypothetical protein